MFAGYLPFFTHVFVKKHGFLFAVFDESCTSIIMDSSKKNCDKFILSGNL